MGWFFIGLYFYYQPKENKKNSKEVLQILMSSAPPPTVLGSKSIYIQNRPYRPEKDSRSVIIYYSRFPLY